MEIELIKWGGLALSFLAAFLFSLYHISLSTTSRISVSRFLEDRDRDFRAHVLDIFDDLKISAEVLRAFFLIAFLVYFFLAFPQLRFWPLWFFLLAFGLYFLILDLIPRFINAANPRRVLGFYLSSFQLPYLLSRPLVWIARRLTPEREPEEQREASEEEIDALIEEAEEEGIIEKEEGDLLKSVVEFGDTIVREIMTPRVSMACIRRESNISQLRNLVIEVKHSRIPVFRERVDNIEGIVNAKDLLEYSADSFMDNGLDPLVRPVYFIPESMKVSELLKEFQKRKQKLAVVVDEHGGVSGLVTMEDLMEEIVGEIQDEYDMDEVQIVEEDPGVYNVLGDAEVEDLEDIFDIKLAEDDFITVGGLITHHLGRLPQKGEKVSIKGLRMEVVDVGQKRIRKLRINREEEDNQVD